MANNTGIKYGGRQKGFYYCLIDLKENSNTTGGPQTPKP